MQNLHHKDLRLCPDCDLVISVPDINTVQEAHCPRCSHVIESSKPLNIPRLLALLITGLVLYLPANLYPVLYMELAGQEHNSSIWNGVQAFWNEGFTFVAVLVFFSAMLVPLIRLLILLPILIAAYWQTKLSQTKLLQTKLWQAKRLYRFYIHLCEWGMVEIYMLGVLVSIIKLADLATVQMGAGLFCYTGLMLVEIAVTLNLNEHKVWRLLGGRV